MNPQKIAQLITEDPNVRVKRKKKRKKISENKTINEGREAEKKSHLVQYIREGNTFRPMGDIELVKTLPAASYTVESSMQGPVLRLASSVTDELVFFEDSKMARVLAEAEKFWGLKENFDKLGYLHNRGILLHGPPGTGKTCLIHQITESMVDQGDIVFQSNDVYSLRSMLESFREVEPDRRLVVCLEDMDEYIGHQERPMLQLLDGANATNNVLFLGTTNYLERFPQRLLRPGRFDKKVHIDYPPENGRLAYLESRLAEIEDPETIGELAQCTDGFSFGHLRELVIAGYAFQEDLAQTIGRLRGVDPESLPIREGWEAKLRPKTLT